MTAGLLLGLLLLLSLVLWLVLRLRQENLMKSRVIEATNCGVLVTDATFPHHPVSYVNSGFLALTGYGEQEVLGQTTAILNGLETDRASLEKLGLALQDGRACRVCLRHYRKNGTWFWNEVTLSPVKDQAGRLSSVIWVMTDVSHVHELETELRSMPPLSILCDRVSEGMLVVTDREVVYANKAGLNILGATSEEQVVGQDFMDIVPPDLRESIRQGIVHTQPSPDSECQRETRFLRIDGQAVAVEMATTSIIWEGQESVLVCFSGMSHSGRMEGLMSHGQQPLRPVDAIMGVKGIDSWPWDVGRGMEQWPAEHYHILGYEPGSVSPTYDTFKKALHPEDFDRVRPLMEETFNSDRPYDVECRIIQPCGDVRFVRCRGVLMRGVPDQPIRMAGTIEDITDYKLMASLAEERVLQFKAVLEATPVGMVMVGREGTISLANANIEHMFGYACEELLGHPIDCLFPAHERSRYAQKGVDFYTASASRFSRTGVELHGLRKDGSTFPAEIRFHPIPRSSGPSVLITIVDLTVHRQADRALQDSQTRLDLVVHAGQVGIFEYDHRTDQCEWSPILRTIHGIGMEEPASLQRYLELVHPADHDAIRCLTQGMLEPREGRVSEVDYRIVRPDGAIRDIHLLSVTLCETDESSSQLLRTIGVVVDATDRKQIVTHARDTSKKESIGLASSGVLHEINNSLTAVLGFSELALPMIPVDNKAHRHLTQVIIAGRKARELAQTIRRALNQSTSLPESVSLPSPSGAEPSTSPIEVPDAVGPCR